MGKALMDGYWGEQNASYSAVDGGPDTQPAGRYMGAASYVGRGKHCLGDNDTCKAYRAKGTEYCAGHLAKQAKMAALQPGIEV